MLFYSLGEEQEKDSVEDGEHKNQMPVDHSKIEETISSAFQYEVSKLENEACEKDSARAGIDKKELEGISSFFQRILTNPFTKESEIVSKDKMVENLKESKSATITVDNADDETEQNSEGAQASEKIESEPKLEKEMEVSEDEKKLNNICEIAEKVNDGTCKSDIGENSKYTCDLPAIPSPSKYEAIEALDEGDEQRELEKWAERTETITRLEHER